MLSFLILSASIILCLFNTVQPQPYMDEYFHLKQTIVYCNGNFTQWDPMITTLPGLYLYAIGVYGPLYSLFKIEFCTLHYLRMLNVIFFVFSHYIIYQILISKQQAFGKAFESLIISTFPVHFFFSFLYYTDSGSTCLVLLAYLFTIRNQHFISASAATFSIFFRQNNIVWIIFFAAEAVYPIVNKIKFALKNDEELTGNINNKSRKIKDYVIYVGTMNNIFYKNFCSLAKISREIISIAWPYFIPIFLFALFIFFNGGIVVGAKEDHKFSLHVVQIFYFSLFTILFSIPIFKHRESIEFCVNLTIKKPLLLIILTIVSALIINQFTIVHRYLLADNRHFTFYIWRRIINVHWMSRYMLIPFYMYSIIAIIYSSRRSILWNLVFSICVVLYLVPSPLFEFRYFIIPSLILRLNMKSIGVQNLVTCFGLHILINCVTISLFLFWSFHWPKDNALQRFMW